MYRAPVAQMDRAFASGAKGRRFESCQAYHSPQNNSSSRKFEIEISNPASGHPNLGAIGLMGIRKYFQIESMEVKL